MRDFISKLTAIAVVYMILFSALVFELWYLKVFKYNHNDFFMLFLNNPILFGVILPSSCLFYSTFMSGNWKSKSKKQRVSSVYTFLKVSLVVVSVTWGSLVTPGIEEKSKEIETKKELKYYSAYGE